MPDAKDTFRSMRIVDPSRRSLVLLSGGLDSSVMAAWLQAHGHEVEAVYLDFGQGNYEREFPAAQRVWRHLKKAELAVVDLYQWRQSFKDEQQRDRVAFGSLPRNALLVVAAIPQARLHLCDWIAIGSTLDDASTPDCSSEFIERMNRLLVTLRQRERLVAPWLAKENPWRKAGVVRWALQRKELGRPFIDLTWSCWHAKDRPCGECQPCRALNRALEEARSPAGSPGTAEDDVNTEPRRARGKRRDSPDQNPLVTDGQLFRWFQESQSYPLTGDVKSVVEQSLRSIISKESDDARPGMLLGRVQSGKTRAYIGLLAMAFDSGFEMAIVLTKNSVPLAEQTVRRLEDAFRRAVEQEQLQVYDLRSKLNELTEWHLKQRLILVSMKEQKNLDRLATGEGAVLERYPALKTRRCLVIDDEADFASVGYTKDGSVVRLNPIHYRLDGLRSRLTQSSFLQVTATPYALYLQPEGHIAAASPEGLRSQPDEGLYMPTRPAFTHILPEAPGYVGGEFYFEASRQDSPAASQLHRPISDDELNMLEMEGPAKLVDKIVAGEAVEMLRFALLAFVVGGYMRRWQQSSAGQTVKRYCFIVHTITTVEGHKWQASVVGALLDRLREGTGRSWFSRLCRQVYEDLISSVGSENQLDFGEMMRRIGSELGAVSTSIVNSEIDLENLLDDKGQLAIDTPYKIFIGGQSLDRGITVENLIGFYYGRRATVVRQDTVLQHSRMYGYRSREDLAVTRFYTTNGIYESMVQIDEFDRALRDALRRQGPDHGVVFLQTDSKNRIEPSSPEKIQASRLMSVRTGDRVYNIPLGFNTRAKRQVERVYQQIDELLRNAGIADTVATLPLEVATRIIGLIAQSFEYPESDSWDDSAFVAVLRYLASQSEAARQSDKVAVLVRRDRKRNRVRQGGRFQNAPDSSSDREAADKKLPTLILFEMRGDAGLASEKGWKAEPFWWPVVRAGELKHPIVFATRSRQKKRAT